MTAEIICVGTELLLGDILNTNAQFLSRELAELGISVLHQHVIGDNPARLRELVTQAKSRSDLLIFSGGLGPTEDDLTKETVAEAFGDTLHFDEVEWDKILAFFARTNRRPTENNRKQAMVPTNGHKIINDHGTAPGAWFEDAQGHCAALMPGVPREMKAMWLEQVRPLLDHLGALAKELDMAVLLISHMSKPGPGVCSALDRLLGSSDFRNAARSILIAGRDPEHPEVRVVAHAKNSLGQPGESQRYRICPQGTVAYDGPCTLTADAIIREAGTPATGNGRPSAALANAIEALEKQLSFVGWVEAGEVYRLCAERDISVSTIRRARVALGLKTLYIGNQPNRKNYWYQPELEEASVVADITNQNQQIQLA